MWSPFPSPLALRLTATPVIYFFFPETARLTLEEIAQKFGEEVAVHLTDATDEEKAQLDNKLIQNGDAPSYEKEVEKETTRPSPVDGSEQDVPK